MGSGLEYGTAYYTVFVFESSGSAKYAVVQVPLRFRFDRDVLVFSQAAPLPDVREGGGKENKRASGRAETAHSRIMRSCHHSHIHTHTHRERPTETHTHTHAHTEVQAHTQTRTRFLKP